MAFSVAVAQDRVAGEPGQTTPLTVTINNRADARDEYELGVEGLDGDWTLVPVATGALDANETVQERIFFKPPRVSNSTAGDYPFVVRVRSLESGESRTAQGILTVKPFHNVSAELDPKKGYVSPFKRHNAFDLALVNLGNAPHTIHLAGSDPEDALAFDFESDSVAVPAGGERTVRVVANPRSRRVLSSARLFGFSVTGRSAETPSVVTGAQAQLEQRALLSPLSLMLTLLAAAILGAWVWAMPKPPTVMLTIEPGKVLRGGSVTVRWRATDASVVRIYRIGEESPFSTPDLAGERAFKLTNGSTARFQAVAERDGRRVRSEAVSVEIEEPPVIPEASISELSSDKRSVKLGDSFVLRYLLKDAQSAKLFPDGLTLDVNATSLTVRPAVTGKVTYEVIAYNTEARPVSKKFTITVYDESTARITAFAASPERPPSDGGLITFSWSTAGAFRTELKGPNGAEPVSPTGSAIVRVDKRTEFTLTAYDDQNRPVRRRITVRPLPAPKPVEPDSDPLIDPTQDPASGPTSAEPPAIEPSPPATTGTR